MKKISFYFSRSIFLALSMMLILTMVASAASTTKNLSTNYTVVNMGSETAIVAANYYRDNGTSWTADADKTNYSVAANFGQMVVAQYFDSTMSAGKGSAVLSSSQPLGAVVTLQARGQTPTNGAYVGFSNPNNTYYVPLVIRKRMTANGLANTQIMIQNIESSAITARVEFVPSPGSGFSTFTKTNITIQPFSTFYYDIEEESAANLPNEWIGSAVVSAVDSTKQIAVVVNIFTGPHGLQTMNGFPVSSAGQGWAIPQFASRLPNGFNTVINVQNVSNNQIEVGGIQMQCNPSEGFTGTINYSNSIAVPSKATFGISPVSDMTLPTNWQGSCTINATQNVVAFVTLRRPGITSEISAYEAFQLNSTATKVVIPLMAKRLANGFATAAVIMNLDPNNSANVTLKYTRGPGITVGAAQYQFNATIPAGGNLHQNLRLADAPSGISMPSGWQGTLVVEPQSGHTGRPIVAYVALTNVLVTSGDTQMAHTAFLLP